MQTCDTVKLTAVIGGRAALSFPYDRTATLKRWRACKRNAPYGAHRAETIIARSLPLDVADHLALGVNPLAHATSWMIICVRGVRMRVRKLGLARTISFYRSRGQSRIRADIREYSERLSLEYIIP